MQPEIRDKFRTPLTPRNFITVAGSHGDDDGRGTCRRLRRRAAEECGEGGSSRLGGRGGGSDTECTLCVVRGALARGHSLNRGDVWVRA